MKHNMLNCYIDGKKAAIAIVENVIYLMSHSSTWAGVQLDNMLGWKFARRICAVGPVTEARDMKPGYIKELLFDFAGVDAREVIVDGTPEFDAIRANIRKCPGRSCKRSPRPEAPEMPEAPQTVPDPAPVPEPAPVPVPAPKKAPAEVVHEKYNTLLAIMGKGEAAYLYGPAGSGKNHVCEQIARALGVEFYYQNSVTDEYKLTGFIDGSGVYHETEFYRAFKNGGLFMLDEMDASCPDTLVTLNAALANGYFTFPCGRVKMHPDFHCIAAGNTCGRGATEEYTGRSVLDAASLNRFMPVKFDYCWAIENKLAGAGGADILEFIRDMRESAAAAGIHIVLGYRNIQRLAKFRDIFNARELVEYCVTGGYDKDEINILKAGLVHKDNPFALAM